MITKNYKSILIYLLTLTISIFIVGCDQEDNTGYSNFEITSPTLSVSTSVSNKSLIEDGSSYSFTATLSTAQLVDIKLHVSQIAGDAIAGDDYTVDSELVISAGSLSATGKITILTDELAEDTETVKIQIGDERTANAILTPATMEFSILNYTEGDLAIDFDWAMAAATTDDSGAEIDPTDFVDMILSISSTPDATGDIDVADGGSFESLVLPADTPDGTYYAVASFYSGNDIARDLNLSLTLNQTGVTNDLTYNFPAALNSSISCENIYYVMAMITKSGTNYTLEQIGESNEVTAAPFIGTATVLVDDWADDYINAEIEIEAGSNPYEFYVRMYSNPYIDNPNTAYLIVTIDPATGNVTGTSNEPWDYGNTTPVTATGSVDLCSKTIDLILDYWYNMGNHYSGYELKLQL